MPSRGMIVLAGGRSSRMGRDKAWLEVGDETALGRVVRAGLEAGVEQVVVVGSADRSLPPLPASVARVDDPAERIFEGPLSGLAVGLDHLAGRGIATACVAPCDALMTNEAHLRFVLDVLDDYGGAAVVPVSGSPGDDPRRLHPLSGALRVEPARTEAHALLARGRRAAKDLFAALSALSIPVQTLPDPGVVQDCNTPEQWERAVARLRARQSPGSPAEDVE